MVDSHDISTRRRRPHLTADQCDDDALSSSDELRRRRRRRKKKRRQSELDPPFHVLVMQVGATLFTLCFITFYLWQSLFLDETEVLIEEGYDDDSVLKQEVEEAMAAVNNQVPTQAPTVPTAPPLPVWELGEATQFDAFGIADTYSQLHKNVEDDSSKNQAFWTTTASLRKQFTEIYGGENAVRAMMERGFTLFPLKTNYESPPTDLVHTACRIRLAKEEGRPFKFTFGGYSVTVGRGNYFGQSYPFVMKRILDTPFQLLGINLSVQNAAIGGCPSFPYGFCKKNHWGEDSDVVSWDFSMNEAGGVAEGLEAYLRHTMTLSHRPKLIVKDTQMADKRRDLLKRYVALGAIKDPVVLHSDPAVRPFLDRKEEFRPEGFQNWRRFGSPPGAPGQALHHPAVKEHEMLGWMLAMHFISALELVAANDAGIHGKLQFTCPSVEEQRRSRLTTNLLPPPVTTNATSMKEWSSMFFGVPKSSKSANKVWKMNPIHCRTSYDPIVNQSGSLTSIVVSGSIAEDMDVMLPKGHMFYNRAWTFDLSEAEKDAKRKLERYGGLGFVDSKKAYRGLFTSGTLKFLLPYYEEAHENDSSIGKPKVGDSARTWFQNVIICEVNEKSESSACQISKDITFRTGGVNSTEVTLLDTPGTLYLGKKICAVIEIPHDAKITSKETMLLEDPTIPASKKKSLTETIEAKQAQIGLSLELTVNNHLIVAREKACSVSHVVWEQRTPEGVRLPLKAMPEKKAKAQKDETARVLNSGKGKHTPKTPPKGDNVVQTKPNPKEQGEHDKVRGHVGGHGGEHVDGNHHEALRGSRGSAVQTQQKQDIEQKARV